MDSMLALLVSNAKCLAESIGNIDAFRIDILTSYCYNV